MIMLLYMNSKSNRSIGERNAANTEKEDTARLTLGEVAEADAARNPLGRCERERERKIESFRTLFIPSSFLTIFPLLVW